MMLRHYRDSYLMQTEEGKRIVEEYYEIAPRIVLAIWHAERFFGIYEGIYRDYLAHASHLPNRKGMKNVKNWLWTWCAICRPNIYLEIPQEEINERL